MFFLFKNCHTEKGCKHEMKYGLIAVRNTINVKSFHLSAILNIINNSVDNI